MSSRPFVMVLEHVRRLAPFGPGGADGDDAQLLDRFVNGQDRDAFAQLVTRHGPLVLWACRRILGHEADAEDAFQATFLVLARKAATVRQRSLAGWLYTVARRVAWNARAGLARRRLREHQVPDMRWAEEELAAGNGSGTYDPARAAQRHELEAVVEQELGRLPAKYRLPLLLCDLLGRTHADAAHELGLPQGSVSRHLERGRELLRARLSQRGVTLGAAAIAAVLSESARAAVPAAWVQPLAEAAALYAAGSAVPASLLSERAIALSHGVLRAMWMQNVRIVLLSVLCLGLLAGGAGLLAFPGDTPDGGQDKKAPGPVVQQKPAQEPQKTGLYERFSVTEKPEEDKGVVSFVFVKEGGVFFSADGATVYVHRGGGGVGLGVVGGAGFGGAALEALGGGMQSSPDTLAAYAIGEKKKAKEFNGVQAVALSPTGKSLAVVGVFGKKGQRSIRLVNPVTGQPSLSTPLPDPAMRGFGIMGGEHLTPFMGGIAFTPDAKTVVIQNSSELQTWDVGANKVKTVAQSPLQALVGVSPEGKRVLTSSIGAGFAGGQPDSAVSIWDLGTGKSLRSFGDTPVARVALSPDGRRVVMLYRGVGGFGLAGGFGAQGGGGFGFAGGAVGFGGGAGIAGGAVGSPGGGQLGGALGALGGGGQLGGAVGAIGGAGNPPANGETAKLHVWDVTGTKVLTCDTKVAPEMVRLTLDKKDGFLTVPGGLYDVAFSPDGRLLASCLGTGEGGFVHVFDAATGKELTSVKTTFCPQAIAFSRDGALLATAGGVGPLNLRVWDVVGLTSPGGRKEPESP